ncbi:MAG: IPT/TIG domain-containing protein, partial [Nocardioides sp.]
LLYHGGPMMSTQKTGDKVVVTPIFWEPPGLEMTASYKSVITTYLQGLAADSGKLSNVFSSMYQYSGSNGAINYKMKIGTPISDTTALPADGCTLQAGDTTDIYADATGYSHCLDDDQVIAETDGVVSAHGLPSDLGHLYVTFLPKHVESCFYPGATNTNTNFCTLNHQLSAAYCAYHSMADSGTVYANMPFPAYLSGTNYSCTKESLGGGGPQIQSPNGDTDADVEISPLSHEMAEAITDPDVNTGWWDSSGNENGDDCAYIYGTLSGTAGALYNQTVHGKHYLTQEEFSNKDFVANKSGCIQHTKAVKPVLKSLSKHHGSHKGGSHITIKGKGFPGAKAVHFGKKKAKFTVLDASHISVKVPKHSKGKVDVRVTTAAGKSKTTKADRYTYK